ncbi:MAG TPA: FAD-dependent oxidoreductase [Acidimicrobiales bacterium]|nr:FAD-dependent oxidoreductase [Acidimicrobiales bacterium]
MPPVVKRRLQTITIVGGSLAGLRAAEALRREGFDGRLAIVSGENHLPYDRPPLSKQVLAGAWEPERARLFGAAEVDAEWLLGVRATGFDAATRTLLLDRGDEMTADGVIIATGATPRRLPGPELRGVHTLRTMSDCLALRDELESAARVAVVGSGFIGSEVASTCRGRGLDVTVIEALPVPLERALGPIMGDICGRLHPANGVDLRLGVGVDALEGDGGRVERVRLSDGSAIEADVVVVGIGVLPETGWLDGSGLTIDNGVVCDAWCQAAPGVVAAGDVARWYNPLFDVMMRVEHWANAVEQSEAAARTLVHGADGTVPFAPVPYFWSDQYDAKIQFLGHAAAGDDVMVVEGSPEEGRFVAAYGRDGRLVGALLFNRPARLPRFKSLIAERASFPPAVPPAVPAVPPA